MGETPTRQRTRSTESLAEERRATIGSHLFAEYVAAPVLAWVRGSSKPAQFMRERVEVAHLERVSDADES